MGRQDVAPDLGPEAIRVFTKSLLEDLRALERMVSDGIIESGITRIGAEQEMFLVDQRWRAAPLATTLLPELEDANFTTELALFNLETNLDPVVLQGDCFTRLETQLRERVALARTVASRHRAEIVLTGILPSLNKSDLSLDNITPRPRYHALNEALTKMRGGVYRLRIDGTDELHIEHDSPMLEACNTSFQVHLQVSADEFAHCYNVAQALTAPVLAVAVNSPLLFGRRLWAETRIALFQQSLDTRSASPHLRELAPRVSFGEKWVERSVVEVFQQDIMRFRVLMATDVEKNPIAELDAGRVPKLDALQLHNSTVYRWNRPCYGISSGKPHLRIECRSIPAGPSTTDEVANAAFWIGLVRAGATEYSDLKSRMDFDDAKANFLAAARHGLNAVFTWVDGEAVKAADLVRSRLLPLAQRGLLEAGVDREDVDRYLGVIAGRVESGVTGAQWLLRSLQSLKNNGTRAERLAALTAATVDRQRGYLQGHEWPLARLEEAGGWKQNYLTVEQYMVTDLFTVSGDELVDLVAFLMDRQKIRHVLVEDAEHRLIGLVSYRAILRIVATGGTRDGTLNIPVKDIMVRDLVTITPETTTLQAIEFMRTHRLSILPVVKNDKLVGVVTEDDFLPIARELIEEKLREAEST
jgi:CBS domain-containing protein/gamma-glutamylcysteine synthetase